MKGGFTSTADPALGIIVFIGLTVVGLVLWIDWLVQRRRRARRRP